MNTHLFIIGNGFSINLINKLGMQDSIDLVNLFRIGDRVMHPDDKTSCFLSRKYCPDLWGLGAKSTLSAQESNNLIRDIITSMNVCHLCIDDSKRQDDFQKSSYYKAYCQQAINKYKLQKNRQNRYIGNAKKHREISTARKTLTVWFVKNKIYITLKSGVRLYAILMPFAKTLTLSLYET